MIKDGALQALKKMLQDWGISPDDWYVTGEAAMFLSGYATDFRTGQMDVLVCRSSWPWERPEEQVSLLPDKETKAATELHEFVEKFKIMPDFHPLPHVGISAESRFEQTYWYPDEDGVRVLHPWAGIYHRKLIIEFYENSPKLNLDVFDKAKFIRWKKFAEDTINHAQQINDLKTIEIGKEVLPVIERAIKYFENKQSNIDSNCIKGICAYPGTAKGEAKYWSPNANYKNKIAVLTHSLPEQISLLREAAGIITDQGGTLSHAATIAREYKIPTIIGTGIATKNIQEDDVIEMDAEKGIIRIVK